MHPSHMIIEVPAAWKPVTRKRSFAVLKETEVRVLAMTMHAVCLSLMTEKTCIRGEASVGVTTLRRQTTVGAEVRIEVFTSLASAMNPIKPAHHTHEKVTYWYVHFCVVGVCLHGFSPIAKGQ